MTSAADFSIVPGREQVVVNGTVMSLEAVWDLIGRLKYAYDVSEAPGCYCICMVERRPCPVHRLDRRQRVV